MLPSSSVTDTRTHAAQTFHSLHLRAVAHAWLAKVLLRNNTLKSFVASGASGLQARRMKGIHCIPVNKIVGTIHRSDDFDRDFRPLKLHLRDRWVTALLQLKTDAWQPIRVHKVGDSYFVKDGHHQVSVAKSAGVMFIDAEVWDHSAPRKPQTSCMPTCEPVRKRTGAYPTN